MLDSRHIECWELLGNDILANIDLLFMSFLIFHTFRIKRDLIIGNMSNNEETGPSDQDAQEMDYEGEQEFLDYLTAKKSQALQVGLDHGTDADIDTDGAGTDGGAETGGKVPAPMPLPKRRSRRSRGYENLTN